MNGIQTCRDCGAKTLVTNRDGLCWRCYRHLAMTCKCTCGCPLTLLPFEQRTKPTGLCAYCAHGNHDHRERDSQ